MITYKFIYGILRQCRVHYAKGGRWKKFAFDIDQTLNVAKTPIPDEICGILGRMFE